MVRKRHAGGMGMAGRKKTFVAKTASVSDAPDYKLKPNPITGRLTRVVNNITVLQGNADDTDPTSGGGAANGRFPITLSDGTIKYLAYYDAP